jgi:hypothetical protein
MAMGLPQPTPRNIALQKYGRLSDWKPGKSILKPYLELVGNIWKLSELNQAFYAELFHRRKAGHLKDTQLLLLIYHPDS